ncbi:MAG: hypothetical protein O7E57_18935 [Gammaproteobacteria bacterium]|nr:hypothetical protein [Gammaproteobacteria bacterium]
MKPFLFFFLSGVLWGAPGVYGAEQKPPWIQEEVILAALEIRMTEEQLPQFRQAISNFFDSLNSAVHKLVRRNVTNLPREIRRKRNIYVKRMDAEMAEFLTQEQMPGYYEYRDLLLARMSNERRSEPLENLEGPASHNQ